MRQNNIVCVPPPVATFLLRYGHSFGGLVNGWSGPLVEARTRGQRQKQDRVNKATCREEFRQRVTHPAGILRTLLVGSCPT
jgi:hypothetical protein